MPHPEKVDRSRQPLIPLLILRVPRLSKQITWSNSDRVGISQEKTKIVLRGGLPWLVEQDKPLHAPADQVKDLPEFDFKST